MFQEGWKESISHDSVLGLPHELVVLEFLGGSVQKWLDSYHASLEVQPQEFGVANAGATPTVDEGLATHREGDTRGSEFLEFE